MYVSTKEQRDSIVMSQKKVHDHREKQNRIFLRCTATEMKKRDHTMCSYKHAEIHKYYT